MMIMREIWNQELSVMWNVLKILNILIRNIYVMVSSLILVNIILVIKVTNIFCKQVTSPKISPPPSAC